MLHTKVALLDVWARKCLHPFKQTTRRPSAWGSSPRGHSGLPPHEDTRLTRVESRWGRVGHTRDRREPSPYFVRPRCVLFVFVCVPCWHPSGALIHIEGLLGGARRLFQAVRHIEANWATCTPSSCPRGSRGPHGPVGHARCARHRRKGRAASPSRRRIGVEYEKNIVEYSHTGQLRKKR